MAAQAHDLPGTGGPCGPRPAASPDAVPGSPQALGLVLVCQQEEPPALCRLNARPGSGQRGWAGPGWVGDGRPWTGGRGLGDPAACFSQGPGGFPHRKAQSAGSRSHPKATGPQRGATRHSRAQGLL